MNIDCIYQADAELNVLTDKSTYNAYIIPIYWMKSLTNNNIIMCGHNSKAFDCVHFINALDLSRYHWVS